MQQYKNTIQHADAFQYAITEFFIYVVFFIAQSQQNQQMKEHFLELMKICFIAIP